MRISFAGHSFVSGGDRVKEIVKEQLRHTVAAAGRVTCYLGGYGDFDEISACACRELKREHGNVELVYVTPYIGPSEQEKIKEMQKSGRYDAVIYPPLETVPPRLAIAKRNEWMMTNADIIIAYVIRPCGGAYRSLEVARRRKKKIINLGDLL